MDYLVILAADCHFHSTLRRVGRRFPRYDGKERTHYRLSNFLDSHQRSKLLYFEASPAPLIWLNVEKFTTRRFHALMSRNPLLRPRRAAAGLTAVLSLLAGGLLASSPAYAATATPGRFLLVGGLLSQNVAVHGVAKDGTLSKVSGSPFSASAGFSIVVTPDGKKAYVASLTGSSITGYRIGSDGKLTAIPGGKVGTGAAVVGLALTPDGSRLFATMGGGENEVRSYDVAASGTLTKTTAPPAAVPGDSALSLPALTPDGRFLFVTSTLLSKVTSFAVAPDGRLTLIGQYPTGNVPALPAVTPDGRFLYISNEQGASMIGFAIGADGALTPTPGGPYPTGDLPHGAAITADSGRLYVPTAGSGAVEGFRIGADGALTSLPGSPFDAPDGMPGRTVLSPDGKVLFLADVFSPGVTSRVHSYTIGENGGLAPTGLPATNTGVLMNDGPSAVLTPDQGPTASVRVVSAQGGTGFFSAAASSDPDGRIVRYDWDFSDGQTSTTTEPEVAHTFTGSGPRTVRVTVTDDEGCSTKAVFTGQTVSCNGGPRATASVTAP
ncbi:6-phosphogluconolactonase, cycloisomerase 2 family [Amycolatopsis lurida]|nr:6-phosphogluconolactonase, cycloisomerase 2 family [Amycolatopsis lurida]